MSSSHASTVFLQNGRGEAASRPLVSDTTLARDAVRLGFRILRARGLTEQEATNILAVCLGARLGTACWTLHELLTLLWFREQQAVGSFGPRDGAESVSSALEAHSW